MTNADSTQTDAQPTTTIGQTLDDLAERCETTTDLETFERETSFHFSRADDRADVYSEEKAICKRLLMHPEFDLEMYTTSHPDAPQQSIDVEEYHENGHDKRKPVYAVKGTIPIGCLKVAHKSRQSSGHADVVSGGVLK